MSSSALDEISNRLGAKQKRALKPSLQKMGDLFKVRTIIIKDESKRTKEELEFVHRYLCKHTKIQLEPFWVVFRYKDQLEACRRITLHTVDKEFQMDYIPTTGRSSRLQLVIQGYIHMTKKNGDKFTFYDGELFGKVSLPPGLAEKATEKIELLKRKLERDELYLWTNSSDLTNLKRDEIEKEERLSMRLTAQTSYLTLDTKDILDIITHMEKKVARLKLLDSLGLKFFEKHIEIKEHAAGKVVMKQGDPPKEVMLVVEGDCRLVYDDLGRDLDDEEGPRAQLNNRPSTATRPTTASKAQSQKGKYQMILASGFVTELSLTQLGMVGPHSMVGDIPALLGGVQPYTVQTLGPVTAMHISEKRFRDDLENHPEVHKAVLRSCKSRLEWLNQRKRQMIVKIRGMTGSEGYLNRLDQALVEGRDRLNEVGEAELEEALTPTSLLSPNTQDSIRRSLADLNIDQSMAVEMPPNVVGLLSSKGEILSPMDSPRSQMKTAYRLAGRGSQAGRSSILDYPNFIKPVMTPRFLKRAMRADVGDLEKGDFTPLKLLEDREDTPVEEGPPSMMDEAFPQGDPDTTAFDPDNTAVKENSLDGSFTTIQTSMDIPDFASTESRYHKMPSLKWQDSSSAGNMKINIKATSKEDSSDNAPHKTEKQSQVILRQSSSDLIDQEKRRELSDNSSTFTKQTRFALDSADSTWHTMFTTNRGTMILNDSRMKKLDHLSSQMWKAKYEALTLGEPKKLVDGVRVRKTKNMKQSASVGDLTGGYDPLRASAANQLAGSWRHTAAPETSSRIRSHPLTRSSQGKAADAMRPDELDFFMPFPSVTQNRKLHGRALPNLQTVKTFKDPLKFRPQIAHQQIKEVNHQRSKNLTNQVQKDIHDKLVLHFDLLGKIPTSGIKNPRC